MISVVENKETNKYEIRFRYDEELIQLVKNVAGRRWEPEYKMWTIPRDRLGFLINQLKGTPYEDQLNIQSSENIDVNQKLGTTNYIPEYDLSGVEEYIAEGCNLYEHQRDFMRFALYRKANGYKDGFLLADMMGCGKTAEVLQLAMYNKNHEGAKHCLIICCTNSSKFNWKEDIEKHTNGQEIQYIIGSRLRRDKKSINTDTGSKAKYDDLTNMTMYGKKDGEPLPYFLVVNIEALRYKVGKDHLITNKIVEMVNNGEISLIAIDEIHRNASPKSMQGKQILNIKKKINTHIEWIPMTGTPIVKKPTDVFLPLKLVGGHDYSNYWNWCQQFCLFGGFGGHEIVGYKNIDQLKQMLEPNMLRRLKSDVLDLPEKVHNIEYVSNSQYQQKLYGQIVNELANTKEHIISSLNPMTKFLRLRQVNGSPELVDRSIQVDKSYLSKNAKLSRLIEIIDDIVANDEKVVVFSNWVEPLRTLYKYISKKYKTCVYTGTMSSEDRQKHKEVFINNSEYKVMLGTVGALGTSHTLTVANNVIFYDEPWNPSDKVQCEDRCHRAGTTKTVNVYTLICENTIDEVVHNIVYRKEGISNYIVDNDLDLKQHPELFDILLGGKK